MSKIQLNTGRVQVGDLREVARLELLELLDRFFQACCPDIYIWKIQVSWY